MKKAEELRKMTEKAVQENNEKILTEARTEMEKLFPKLTEAAKRGYSFAVVEIKHSLAEKVMLFLQEEGFSVVRVGNQYKVTW